MEAAMLSYQLEKKKRICSHLCIVETHFNSCLHLMMKHHTYVLLSEKGRDEGK